MDDNGSGNAGGNGSVYWLVRSGYEQSSARRRRKGREVADPLAPPGHVLVGDNNLVQGHTREPFKRIGRSATIKRRGEHPGLFLVRLRFRTKDLGKLTPEQREWVRRNRDPKLSNEANSYVIIYVPAINRQVIDGQFDDTDWEIHWEW
jgi:hypothetical protein